MLIPPKPTVLSLFLISLFQSLHHMMLVVILFLPAMLPDRVHQDDAIGVVVDGETKAVFLGHWNPLPLEKGCWMEVSNLVHYTVYGGQVKRLFRIILPSVLAVG
jgi:hypothetical protein